MTNEERANKLGNDLSEINPGSDQIDLILAHDDEIRRECVERAWNYVASKATSQTFGMGLTKHDMEAAIMGKD